MATNGGANGNGSDKEHPAELFREPQSDWVPLAVAPFFYFSGEGCIRSIDDWETRFRQLVLDCASRPLIRRRPAVAQSAGVDYLQGRISVHATSLFDLGLSVSIDAAGLRLLIYPRTGSVSLFEEKSRFESWQYWREWHVSGRSVSEFLENAAWDRAPEDLKDSVEKLSVFSRDLFRSMPVNLTDCLKLGRACLMARKNTILAPFERVSLDQWALFSVDPLDYHDQRECMDWHAVGPSSLDFDGMTPTATASGPAGEKLYAIHVAPCSQVSQTAPWAAASGGQFERAVAFFDHLIRSYPVQPAKREVLEKNAKGALPDVPMKIIKQAWAEAIKQNRPDEWAKPGRRAWSSMRE